MEEQKDPEITKSIKIIVEYLSKNPELYFNITQGLAAMNNATSIWGMWEGAISLGNASWSLVGNEAATLLIALFHKYNGDKDKLKVVALQNGLLQEVQNIDKDLLINFYNKLSEQNSRLAKLKTILPEFIDLFKSLDSQHINNISDAAIDIIRKDKDIYSNIEIIAINLIAKKTLTANFINALVNHLEELDISDKLEVLKEMSKASSNGIKELIKENDITPLDRLKFILSEKLTCSKEMYHCLAKIIIILAPRIVASRELVVDDKMSFILNVFKLPVADSKGLKKLLESNQEGLENLFDKILKNNSNNQFSKKLKSLGLDNGKNIFIILHHLALGADLKALEKPYQLLFKDPELAIFLTEKFLIHKIFTENS